MNALRTQHTRRSVARRAAAVGACTLVASALGLATASAAPDTTTTVTHLTLRLVDDEQGVLYFVNKARADLCTPDRLAFEAELQAWFDGGAVGDPPAEPASSQEGVAEMTSTVRTIGDHETLQVVADSVPVEVWRLDDEGTGVDCTATDGPGAELVASGPMRFTLQRNATWSVLTGPISLSGVVTTPDGARLNVGIAYLVVGAGPRFDVHGVSRWVDLG
jgi:hypothetical protein